MPWNELPTEPLPTIVLDAEYTASEAASLINCTPNTITLAMREGRLKAVRGDTASRGRTAWTVRGIDLFRYLVRRERQHRS